MPEFRALLSQHGEMAQRIRAFHWSATPLGAPSTWPQSLRSALSICLNCPYPTAIYWGSELRLLYNDSWREVLGPRHPDALGRPAEEVWADIWHIVGPQCKEVIRKHEGLVQRNQHLPMRRYGKLEETYWDYSFTPIAGEDGAVAGIFNQGYDRTSEILSKRRDALLLDFGDRARRLTTHREIVDCALDLISTELKVKQASYGELLENASAFRSEASRVAADAASPPVLIPIRNEASREKLLRGEVDVLEAGNCPGSEVFVEQGFSRRAIASAHVDGGAVGAIMVTDGNIEMWGSDRLDLLRIVTTAVQRELVRVRTANALRASEEKHRLIFEQARDTIITADLDQRLTACNAAGALALGVPVDQIIGRSIAEFLSPEDFERSSSALTEKLGEGGTTQYEVNMRVAGGRVERWDIKSSLLINDDGQPIGLQAIARDVTEQRAFEHRQQLLINELNHRVKNTLALVQGLALQSFRGRSADDGQSAFQARLAVLAAAHDLLTQEKWEGATLALLAEQVVRSFKDRVDVIGPYIALAPKASISLVLALHELGTNALKFGALSVPEGRVEIKWSRGDGQRFRLSWRETGGPPAREPAKRGFGMRLIERALATDLDGTTAFAFTEGGLVCTIDAEMPEIAA